MLSVNYNNDTKFLKLNTNPLLTDIRLREGRVDVCSCTVIPKEINECNLLRYIQPIGFKILQGDDSIGSADRGRSNGRNRRGKGSCKSSIETSKGFGHALESCGTLRCSNTLSSWPVRSGRLALSSWTVRSGRLAGPFLWTRATWSWGLKKSLDERNNDYQSNYCLLHRDLSRQHLEGLTRFGEATRVQERLIGDQHHREER